MFFSNRKKLFTRSQTWRICKGGLFERIHFKNFQKNRRHFFNFENFDIFLGSFDRAKNFSSHEKKNQPNMYISWKTALFWKIFWQCLWNCKVIFNSSPFLKKKNFRQTVKHVFLHFECRITYFQAKIFWQPHADLIAWFEMESVYTWIAVSRLAAPHVINFCYEFGRVVSVAPDFSFFFLCSRNKKF